MSVFKMPSLGADMEAGKLVEWQIAPGDTVRRGDIVAVVETQKGAIEIEIFENGTVDRLLAELGETLPVGAPMAMIRAQGEPEKAPSAETVAKAPPAPETPAPTPMPRLSAAHGVAASPAARVKAQELGIDLASVTGTGPGGAILLSDVETATPPSAARDRQDLLAEMRKAIAAAMARSKRDIPHYYVSHTMDLTKATDWLAITNAERSPEDRILMGALLSKAIALSAGEITPVNGHFGENGFVGSDSVHLGVAIALRGGGLVAPAILDADKLDLPELMTAMRDVTTRARAGRLRSSEMSMATITFSGLGERGVDAMAGIILPPQVAIVTAGTPRPAALVRDGNVIAAQAITLTLAADHRVSDGRLGSKFLKSIEQKLQTPEIL